MKRTLLICAFAALPLISNAQLWNGDPLPPAWDGDYVIDPYFVPPGPGPDGLSEFDMDTGFEFSLSEFGDKPAGITEAGGWFNAADFAIQLVPEDIVRITFLGKTAGWTNDFGMNLGGTNVSGPGAYTLWESITAFAPGHGAQTGFVQGANDPAMIDFWLNSNEQIHGGTYSMFFPGTSDPSNTGLPLYDYSARGRIFNVNDSFSDTDRSILVIAIEDWRDFDRDFTDWFFAIEVSDRFGEQQFGVPEPSTYGLIGAMLLLGLVVIRGARNRNS
jgi:hypothetical protein